MKTKNKLKLITKIFYFRLVKFSKKLTQIFTTKSKTTITLKRRRYNTLTLNQMLLSCVREVLQKSTNLINIRIELLKQLENAPLGYDWSDIQSKSVNIIDDIIENLNSDIPISGNIFYDVDEKYLEILLSNNKLATPNFRQIMITVKEDFSYIEQIEATGYKKYENLDSLSELLNWLSYDFS